MSTKEVILYVIYDQKTKKILSELRPPDHPYYPNLKTFPTGKTKKNESLVDALFREIKEELGIKPKTI